MKVCELERSLFESFPKEDAESWDHVGLSVGDPDSTVGRVLVALDATADMVRRAHDAGANVLVAGSAVYGAEDIPAAIQALRVSGGVRGERV